MTQLAWLTGSGSLQTINNIDDEKHSALDMGVDAVREFVLDQLTFLRINAPNFIATTEPDKLYDCFLLRLLAYKHRIIRPSELQTWQHTMLQRLTS